jgi:hypothetical protein
MSSINPAVSTGLSSPNIYLSRERGCKIEARLYGGGKDQMRDSTSINGDETEDKRFLFVYSSKNGKEVTEKPRDIMLHLMKCCWMHCRHKLHVYSQETDSR